MKKTQKPLKSSTILIAIISIIIITSISPVLAADNNSGLADSPWPIFTHDAQNTGQSQYLGAQNNSTKWEHNLTEGNSNDITAGTVIGTDGNIYFGMEYYDGTRTSSKLYSMYPNGTTKWNVTFGDGTNSWGIIPVLGSDGTIYFTNQIDTNFGENESLYAFDPNGNMKWRYNFTDGRDASVMPPTIGADGILYLGGSFSTETNRNFVKFYGFYPNGTPKWNESIMDGDWNSIWTIPVIGKDGSIIFGTYFQNQTGTFGKLYALDPNGNTKWNFIPENITLGESGFIPSIGPDGTIYLGINNENDGRDSINLFALNQDGTLKWNQTFLDGTSNWILGSSVSASGIIYFLSNFENSTGLFGNLYAVNPDGTVKWKYTTGYGSYMPVIGSDGSVYLSLNNGLLAVNPDGTKKWFYEAIGNGFASIARDGTIYFPVHSANNWEISKDSIVAINGQTSDLYVKSTVNNTNPKVGDKITITFKVGNNGPDTAYYTLMKFLIPTGMNFISANANSGNWTYDTATRTITWNLGNVPVGDPTLNVITEILKAGTYTIKPLLTTLTYDPNLVNNVQTIVVNAQSITSNTTGNQTANTINTIGMQKTGIPLNYLIMAILIVVGGFVIPKRK